MTDAKHAMTTDGPANMQLDESSPSSPCARLLLKRGLSDASSWSFADEDVGVRISLGSSSRCTWRIAAQHVAPVELYAVSSGDALHVKSVRPYQGVKLRGIPLGASWVRLEQGDVLEIGRARVEVDLPPPASEETTLAAPTRRRRSDANLTRMALMASAVVSSAWSSLLKHF